MRWKRAFMIPLICFMIGLSIDSGINFSGEKKHQNNLQNYAKLNSRNILMQIIEENNLEMVYGRPKIKARGGLFRNAGPVMELANYFPHSDEIIISSLLCYVPGENNIDDRWDIYPVLQHEMMHFYCDKRSEDLGNGSWPSSNFHGLMELRDLLEMQKDYIKTFDPLKGIEIKNHIRKNEKSISKAIAVRIVSEGLAEYVVESNDFYIPKRFWPKSLSEITPESWGYLVYEVGQQLVKPIVDQFGSRGIDYLILNPPNIETIGELYDWRNHVLEKLASEKI